MEPNQEQSAPIRVLRLFSRLNVGGPSIHVVLLTAGLAPRGYETRLVIGTEASHEGNLLELAADKGVTCESMPSLGREIRPLQDLRALFALRRLMRTYRPQIVHTHAAKAGLLGRVAALLAGVPVVIHTYHGHVLRGYFGPIQTAIFRRLEQLMALVTDRLIAVSPRVKQDLVDMGIAAAERFRVVPLGLELEALTKPLPRGALRQGRGIPHEAPLIGMVGRLVPIKDVATFVHAAARVRQVTPEARFALVGDGEERRLLEDLCARLGMAEVVTFHGWRRDMQSVYGDLDVVVNTSRNEGTPVALIEALAAGRPVVATRVGGTPDLLKDGELGRLVPAGDSEAVAEAILDVLRDRPREGARTRARAARDHVLREHSAERLIGDVDALYRELLRKRRLPEMGGAGLLLMVMAATFILSTVLVPMSRSLGPRLGAMDRPGPRKVHLDPTPRTGGVAVFVSFLLVVLGGYLFAPRLGQSAWFAEVFGNWLTPLAEAYRVQGKIVALGIGSALAFAVGLCDDILGDRFHPATKALGQILAALVVVMADVRTSFLPYDWMNVVVTVLWIVGITNAFNLLDNMDGLAAGVAFVASGVLLLNAVVLGELFVSLLVVAFMGSLAGFLLYNFLHLGGSRIFLGDCGSLFIGFTMACLTLLERYLSHASSTLFPVLMPVLILAVPLIDTFTVIVIRMREGRPIYVGDSRHLSHRLVTLGFSPRAAVLFIWLATFCLGLGALTLAHASLQRAVLVLVQSAGFVALLLMLLFVERRREERLPAP